MIREKKSVPSPILRAIAPACELLECRRLLAGNPSIVQPLPFNLPFSSAVAGTMADSAGQGTGFTSVQPNKTGTEYQPALINLLPASDELTLTTTGTAAAGGSWEGDNTLVNALQTGFNAATGSFTISARLKGPLSNLASPSEQGGIYFGPDDDDYVKLVAVSQPSGQVLQFVDEQDPTGGAAYTHTIPTANSYTSIGAFSAISTLDLQIIANPVTGAVTGSYAINGGAFVALSQAVTLTGTEKSAFFSTDAQAGIMAMAKNNLAPVTVGFDSFGIAAVATTPSVPTTSPTPAVPPAGSAKLNGTILGTGGSYQNDGNTIAMAADANLSTYFDAPTASGNWVGLNLGSPAQITQIQYAPRSGWAGRMVGGIFQGSSTANFSSGVVNLFTISATPIVGVYTVQPISSAATFQYVRYLAPSGSYGNIAELEFDGIPVQGNATTSTTPAAPPAGSAKLTGAAIGTSGSYKSDGNTIAMATDGSLATFFDAPSGNGNWVGLNLGTTAQITQVQYAPRAGWAARMVGGIFQGSSTPDFSAGVVNLFTITAIPTVGVYTVQPISNSPTFQYVRYLGPAGSYGNIAEVEFDGVAVVAPPVIVDPSVTSSNPTAGETNFDRTGFVSCNLNLPNGGINQGTLSASNVYLYQTSDHALVASVINTDAAGSVIVLQPSSPLAADTSYTFVVTAGLKDLGGYNFVPYTITFTTNSATLATDPNVAFSQTALPTSNGGQYTGVVIGPDGDLYASTLTGDIFQFPINADGTLGTPNDITTVITANGGPRIITGIAFDPSSTATNMILWVSSGSGIYTNAPDFSGKISTISGPNFSVYQDYVTNLPRSNSNHMNDQPVFGPDGALYWCQGSNTSMGEADSVWGYRPEHLLNAAILRLNIQAAEAQVAAGLGPIDAQTDSLPAGQTPYNPYAVGAPLTIYATGVRNAYDLIWDTNGHLYAPTNGAAAGGNIPATPAGVTPSAPEELNVPVAEDDYLFDIQQGGYYGHPDPARGQYIFGGGNPVDPASNVEIQTTYPLGTAADPNYRGYAFDFGAHYSPDGAIEYQGSAFGGALNGALLITRYSGGKDIEVLKTDSSGNIISSETGITGFTGFNDPVDVIENDATGYLYVADLGGATLTLLKPIASGSVISPGSTNLYFNDPTGTAASPVQAVTLTNTGNQPLAIPATGINLSGTDGSLFVLSQMPTLPAIVAPGASITFDVAFVAGSSALGIHTASLQIQSNDATTPLLTINLRAITTAGIGGNNEPSLQRILDLYQIPDNVGSADPTQTAFPANPITPNDEVVMQELEEVDPESPLTITPLAVFSGSTNPAAGFGYYTAGTPDSRTQIFTFASSDAQTVDPTPIGATSFNPGTGEFGIFTSFDEFPNTATGTARFAYSEDLFNTYDAVNHRKVRFYPLKNADGTVVPNAFVFATEDYGVAPYYDSNDVVGIIRNVQAAPVSPVIGTQNVNGTTDIEGAPSPTQFAFNAIADTTSVTPNNVVHNTDTLRIDNSGGGPLIISSITSNNAAFSVSTAVTYPLTIAAGTTMDLKLLYAPTHTGTNAEDHGTLTIVSNDPTHPALALVLSGFWQQRGNNLLNGTITEPTVAQLVNDVFGYKTVITNPGQNIDGGGKISAVGDEVLSPYWTRADTNLPLTVRELASYHTEGNASALYYTPQGSKSTTLILNDTGDNAQSILPLASDTTKAPAFGSVSPSGIFGFSVDKSEFSDNSLNTVTGSDQGHHMRFWPAYDASGNLIPNTWIMGQDYDGVNFDYNDNLYLITNMRPAPPATPTNVATAGSTSGVTVSWTAVADSILSGYDVYRSTTASGTYTLLNTTPVTTTTYVDSTTAPGATYYYAVTALDSWGGVSARSTGAAGARPKNTVPPATPANFTATATTSAIDLAWSPDTEVDLAGYNIYRAASATGTFTLLNTALLTTPSFVDSTAPGGATAYYQVTAVNSSGLSSSPAVASAVAPVVANSDTVFASAASNDD